MSILQNLILTEELGIGASTGVGAGVGGLVGGIGGHLYGKFKTRKMTDQDARKKEVAKYRNYGSLAGAGIGAATGMYKAGSAKLKKVNTDLANTKKDLLTANKNLIDAKQDLVAEKRRHLNTKNLLYLQQHPEQAGSRGTDWIQYQYRNNPELQWK